MIPYLRPGSCQTGWKCSLGGSVSQLPGSCDQVAFVEKAATQGSPTTFLGPPWGPGIAPSPKTPGLNQRLLLQPMWSWIRTPLILSSS